MTDYKFSKQIKRFSIILAIIGAIGIAFGFYNAPSNVEESKEIVAKMSHDGYGGDHSEGHTDGHEGDSHGDDYKNKFDKIFKRLSIKYELDFISFLLDGVALNADFNLDDGMHPNEKGVIVISINIEKKLLNILN